MDLEEVDGDEHMEDGIIDTTEFNGIMPAADPTAIPFDETGLLHKSLAPGSDLPLSPILGIEREFAVSSANGEVEGEVASASLTSDNSEDSDDAVEVADPSGNTRIEVQIPPRIRFEPLPYATLQSGLVYDTRMRFHTELNPVADQGLHPEDPRRISEIFKELRDAGLVSDDANWGLPNNDYLWRIEARPAKRGEICLVHSLDHYKWVRRLSNLPHQTLMELQGDKDSIYLHPLTYLCAKLSAGGAIEACRSVVQGHVKNAIAVIRPPGHHAEHSEPSGFCLFNNVPIAARVCQREFGDRCRKVFILDWDVHHGNGVQQAFYDDPNVLYISIHVHQNGKFYPQGPYGDHLHCGEGIGLGKNVNIPWPRKDMHDGDYMAAFQKIVMPIAQEFDPDLVIVSAGFDAAEGDLLGGCHVSPACYGHMTSMLKSLARGKIAVCLEGGYDLRAIARSAVAVTRVLMGEPPDRLAEDALVPSRDGVDTIDLVSRTQSRYWKCMYPKDIATRPNATLPGERLHDVVRRAQAKMYLDEFQMSALEIIHERSSPTFQDEVLATQNYKEDRPMVVLFHDPPEAFGQAHPYTNKLDLHNVILTDETKSYIEMAVQNGFSVIDVNVPKHITIPGDELAYVTSDDLETRIKATTELSTYLWQNYIEMSDSTQIFLVGVGAAYASLVRLLGDNESCTAADAEQKFHLIAFVADNSLKAISRTTGEDVGRWYHENSSIYVSEDHAAWEAFERKAPKRKYGQLHRSPPSNLHMMLKHHRQEVLNTMLEKTEEWRQQERERMQEEQRTNSPTSPTNSRATNSRPIEISRNSDKETGLPPMGTFVMSPSKAGSPFVGTSPQRGSPSSRAGRT